jgi:hypothetical protein
LLNSNEHGQDIGDFTKSRSKRTLTDIKYEEINTRINELELIMTDIYGIQDTKPPQADLRTLLRCLQTASVDG